MKGIIIPLERQELADMIQTAVREAITEYRVFSKEDVKQADARLVQIRHRNTGVVRS